ncbi:9454_t:CDS:2 [Ambispora leptoticha]|uniref:9454_t:CDS:1 n=1 Tax=Ambispora leptoticha TaxID=144679 RepID=A0A9N9A341_9GLOM|nr:9454_t:CDS:2 [Ambispora leptoticha]
MQIEVDDTSNRCLIVNVNKMTSLAILGITPFLDFADLSMFIKKISIYLLIGVMFYFSRIIKKDINIKHNSDLSVRDTTFNEILANCDAKFNAELISRDENFTAEIQRILTILNTSTMRLDEIEQVLQNYHNNFGRVVTEFESINASIVTLQSQASNYSTGQASNHSSASSGQLTFTDISLTVWNQFKQIFDRIMTENNYTLEEICLSVAMDICSLGGNIKKVTVQGFYERNIKKKNSYISTLDQIGLWIVGIVFQKSYIVKQYDAGTRIKWSRIHVLPPLKACHITLKIRL